MLTRYPNINGSHWFSEEGHWIIAKVFRENLMASTLSAEFLVLSVFIVNFHNHKTYCDVLLITSGLKTSFYSHQGTNEHVS